MEVSIKENGNALIDGKEYIPLERLEADIDGAVAYHARKKFINTLLVCGLVIISFLVGLAF